MADKTIAVRLLLDSGQYQSQLLAAAAQTQGFAQSVNSAAAQTQTQITGFSRAAASFGKIVTLGVAGGLALSAKAAIDFESSFAGIRKTVDATPVQFDRLSKSIRNLATEIPISVNELNRIGELGGQLGVEVDGIVGFTRTIAELGVTTNLTTENAALGIARLAAITNTSESEFSNMGSTIVDLGNNFETTEDQILTFATRIAAAGNVVGLTVDQVLAIATAFSSVGVPAERGGTAVQQALIAMSRAAQEGGDELEAFAEIAEVSVDQFITLFEEDAAGAFQAFIEGLGRIEEQGGNVFAVLDEVGLGASRQTQSILSLAVAQGKLDDALRTASVAYAENTALSEEAAKRFETVESQIQLAVNQFKDLGIEIGENLLPYVIDLIEGLTGIVQAVDNADPAVQKLLAAIALLIAGLVTANKVGKIAVGTFGLQLPAALSASTVAAFGLRAILGGGLLAALFVVGSAIAAYGRKQAEAKARTEELVAALEQEAKGYENVATEAVKARLVKSDDIEVFNRLGLSIDEFARAMTGDEEALDSFRGKITDLTDTSIGLQQALATTGFQNAPGFEDRLRELGFSAEQARQFVADLQRVQVLAGETSREYGNALADFHQQVASEARQRDIEAIAEGYESYAEKVREAGLAAGVAAGRTGDLGDASQAAAVDLEALEEAIADVRNELRKQEDSAFAFVDSVISLVEAQDAFNEAGGDNLRLGLELERAYIEMQRAAQDLSGEGIQPLIATLNDMVRQGIITDAQLQLLLADLSLFGPIAGQMQGSASSIIGNLSLIGGAASSAEVPVVSLINRLLGLNAAMSGTAANINQFVRSVQSFRITSSVFSDVKDLITGSTSLFQSLKAQFNAPSFVDVGSQIREAVNRGISGGGGGGGGGGSSISDTLEAEIEDALQSALDMVDPILAAMEAAISKADSLQEVIDAERDLVALREEQVELPKLIAAAEQRLRDARREAAQVTTDEQLEIEAAQEALQRAMLAFEQGRITSTELLKAREELAEAIRSSTATNTSEVTEAEEDLNDLRERATEIEGDIADAEREVLDAKLAVLDAQIQLVEKGREFNELGKEAVDIFRTLATEAGLTAETINQVLSLASGAGTEAGNTSLGSTQPALNGDRQYVVKAGDTLSAIAARLGVSLADLLSLNQRVTNQQGKTRNLDPNLIFPGDILKYHQGGIVPNMPFLSEIPALLAPGEVVINPRLGQGLGGTTIETLVVRGVFDFTDPAAASRIMDSLEREMESRRLSKGSF